MKNQCTSCHRELPPETYGNRPISGLLCPECRDYLISKSRVTMQEFLDKFAAPILVVDDNVKIRGANRSAAVLLRKTPQELGGKLGGEALECTNADEPGGCGRTVHCKSCTIRNCVNETFLTGKPCIDVPAYPDVQMGELKQTLSISITTEKHGKFVLLRIHTL